MSNEIKDARFSHIERDPRFRKMNKEHRKVKIDKRFQGMFTDEKFKLKYTVDKRGRPLKSSSNTDLQRFYEVSDGESDDNKEKDDIEEKDDNDSISEKIAIKSNKAALESQREELSASKSDSDDSDEELEDDSEENDVSESENEDDEDTLKVDRARGVGLSESSSSDEESSEDEEIDDKIDHKWGEFATDAIEVEEATYRLAVCNMDWDRIKARDLLVLLNSFKPSNGVIKSVNIYTSEYGKKRLAEEEIQGPKELVEKHVKRSKDTNEEGEEYHREKLRTYQLNRLKYYYGVAVCDSKETANTIYEQCDGLEYETSSTRLDLRFIPDDMELDDSPKSTATELPDLSTYKPSLFTTTALNQSKVELTWDETDKDRTAIMQRKFTKEDIEAMDVKDYLASSGSEDEIDYYAGFEDPDFGEKDEKETINNSIDKYKSILSSIENDKKKKEENEVEMEISWEPGLKESTEELVKKTQDKNNLSTWEQYLQKKEEKKKKKREEKKVENEFKKDEQTEISDDEIPNDVDLNDPYFQEELQKESTVEKKKKKKSRRDHKLEEQDGEMALLTYDKDDTKKHFSLKEIQENEKSKKRKKKRKKIPAENVQDGFQIDVSDPRFADVFNNPLFNIDPSAKEYKKTKGIEEIINEKLKRKENILSMKDNPKYDKEKGDAKKLKLDSDTNMDPSLMSLVKSIKAKNSVMKKNTSR